MGNAAAFVFAMVFNAAAQFLGPVTLKELTDEWNLSISPANWAFAIWALIYTLLGVWTIYQALPADQVSGRNDDVSVNQIGWYFSINLVLNGLWLCIFVQDSSAAFFLSLLVIIGMLVSQIYIMQISLRNKLNNWEFVGLRLGFSIYTGWVTAATILNICFFLKSIGFRDPSAWLSENDWCPVILWVALAIYWLCTYNERNPVYGVVFLWVVSAIRARHTLVPVIETQLLVILAVHALYMGAITAYCIHEKEAGKCTHGLFY